MNYNAEKGMVVIPIKDSKLIMKMFKSNNNFLPNNENGTLSNETPCDSFAFWENALCRKEIVEKYITRETILSFIKAAKVYSKATKTKLDLLENDDSAPVTGWMAYPDSIPGVIDIAIFQYADIHDDMKLLLKYLSYCGPSVYGRYSKGMIEKFNLSKSTMKFLKDIKFFYNKRRRTRVYISDQNDSTVYDTKRLNFVFNNDRLCSGDPEVTDIYSPHLHANHIINATIWGDIYNRYCDINNPPYCMKTVLDLKEVK